MLQKRVGKTVKEAMEFINKDFGDEVVIISTKELLGNFEVYFASSNDIDSLTKSPSPAETKEPLRVVRPFNLEKLNDPIQLPSKDISAKLPEDDITQSLVKEVTQIKQMIQDQ